MMRWNSRPGRRFTDETCAVGRPPNAVESARREDPWDFRACIFILFYSGLVPFVWEIACSAWLAWLACQGTGGFPSRATMLP